MKVFLFYLFFIGSWLLLTIFPPFLGIYLLWKHSGTLRILGLLILVVLAFLWFSWTSPDYVIHGRDRVQTFSLARGFGPSPVVMWMDNPPQLLVVPDSIYVSPEGDRIFSIDLETRRTQWLPKAIVNLDDATELENLPLDYRENAEGLSISNKSPSKSRPQVELSFNGFILPRWRYNVAVPPFGEGAFWIQEKKHYGWECLAVREADSSPVVVKLCKILLNTPSSALVSTRRWLLGRRFLVIATEQYIDPRLLVLGPLNILQDTQSKDN